ncbi:AAA family ATPase [Methanobrevibacter woesei]|uniref:AAA family ATPase n=1 Tax=Methanobrevibacter woesei TaxID=190976 RepID=UPI00255B6710|nr:ATP-binding protein [Methanobrevibacter woesei]
MKTLPMGDKTNLSDEEFFNRFAELNNFTNLLNSTANGNAPDILLTGIRGVGKTVFLKKIKKELEDNYLVVYLDFSRAECYQKNKMSISGLVDFFYKELMKEAKVKGLSTFDKKIVKFFKTNDFEIKDVKSLNEFPIPIIGKQTNVETLFDYVLELPNLLYAENKSKIKGVIVFIDEFQIIKELNNYMESFLWKLRSYIQNQENVAYVLAGSMSLQDNLISQIASQGGVFGGRLITFHLNPFDKETVKQYLNEKADNLLLTEDGFERFYSCTSGIPAYINIFGRLLPKDVELNDKIIKEEFVGALPYFSTHFISLWSKLSTREQDIVISLLDGPIRRVDIANSLGVTTGSLSHSLNNLQNQGLIMLNNARYEICELMLARWLKVEKDKKGIYPYRG